jgi:acetyl esterase
MKNHTMKTLILTSMICMISIVKVFAAVTTSEHVYRVTDGIDQTLRVYYPDGWTSSDRRYCVVLFHGGSWKSGGIDQFSNICDYFAKRGLVAITATYRKLTDAEIALLPAGASYKTPCVKDAKSAIRWAKNNYLTLGINPNRVITGGSSAGGHIAVLAVLADEQNNPDDPVGVNTNVLAFLLWNPAFNLESDETATEVNAFVHYDKPLPPALFMFGDQDGWKAASDELFKQMRGRGDTAQFWVAKNVGHMFWRDEPWLTQTTLRADRFLVENGILTASTVAQARSTNTVPQSLRAFASEVKVELNWTHVTSQAASSGYKIYRSTQSGTSYQLLASSITNNSYLDTSVVAGTTYYYVVTAQNGGLESTPSTESLATPFAIVSPGAMSHVAVNSGKGDNNYVANVVVSITADSPPSGQIFDRWVVNSGGVTIAAPTSASTSFTKSTLPVVVTATYKSSLVNPVYTGKVLYTTNTSLTTGATVGSGSTLGYQVGNGATLTIRTGGSLIQSDQTGEQVILALGSVDGLASGNLVMNAGTIKGTETGGNNITGISAYGSSMATINGGTITVNENGNPPDGGASTPLNAVGFAARSSSKFVLNGGAFAISENGNGRINSFTAADNAIVEIYGGTWGYFANDTLTTAAPVADILGFVLRGNAQVKLNGIFNVGAGTIAPNTSTGTITGTLRNGDVFNMAFDKTAGGSIVIVPDPYFTWAGSALSFTGDANSDGVTNGYAWLLGAANPNVNASNRLPITNQTMTFQMLPASIAGSSRLLFEYSETLGASAVWTSVPVPYQSGTVSPVTFVVTSTDSGNEDALLNVQISISATTPSGGSVYTRIQAKR